MLRRAAPDRISVRIVWRGEEVSDLVVEQAVNGLQDLSRGAEMEARLLDTALQGVDDAAIAELLTQEGYRSPQRGHVPVRNSPNHTPALSCAAKHHRPLPSHSRLADHRRIVA